MDARYDVGAIEVEERDRAAIRKTGSCGESGAISDAVAQLETQCSTSVIRIWYTPTGNQNPSTKTQVSRG